MLYYIKWYIILYCIKCYIISNVILYIKCCYILSVVRCPRTNILYQVCIYNDVSKFNKRLLIWWARKMCIYNNVSKNEYVLIN